MIDKLIQQLSQELEMEEMIVSQKPGHYILSFEKNIEVEVTQINHAYSFKGIIKTFPQENVEGFLIKVLEANLFGRGTRGAVIGLNPEGNMLTLSLELDYNSSYKDFKNKLEDFVNVINFWRQETDY